MIYSFNKFSKNMSEKLSGSEAVYAFAAWLTTRDNKITMSASNDAAAVAELVEIFNKKQNLEEPREDGSWTDEIIPMVESLVTKNKKDEIFNYTSITENEWRKITNACKKIQNISFDNENDNSTGEKKTILVDKLLRPDQPIKYKVNAELRTACGDWEQSVMYFRIQIVYSGNLTDNIYKESPRYIFDYKFDDTNMRNCFVLIPPVEAGNKLIKTDKGWRAYQDDDITKDNQKTVSIKKEDKLTAWKWLENYIINAVNERHRMLDN